MRAAKFNCPRIVFHNLKLNITPIPDSSIMTEPTIILELTPREASAICEMVLTYNWERGPFGHDVCNIFRALDEVCHEFDHINAQTVTQFGELDPGAIWLEGTERSESVED